MYFNKFHSPTNFKFMGNLKFASKKNKLISKTGSVEFSIYEDNLIRIKSTLAGTGNRNYSESELSLKKCKQFEISDKSRICEIKSDDMSFSFKESTGAFEFKINNKTVIKSTSIPFGISGTKSIMLFDRPKSTIVYGLGEKSGGLDKSNQSFKMWNVDTVAEFPDGFVKTDFDPAYVSIPFYISKYENDYFGIFLDNPYASFFHAGFESAYRKYVTPEGVDSFFAIGTEKGLFDLYLIPGPTLADVVCRFARLTGRHELPPVWSLGYSQCRWGYKSAKELASVSKKLHELKIPTGSMWMDIDYMEGYRVFTYNKKTFSKKDREKYFGEIKSRGSQLVTIIDPGVKVEKGYSVYEGGIKQNVFCKTSENLNYEGVVWPGKTVFPDFSMAHARKWWSEYIKDHLNSGLSGIWIDMNDPATGPVELDDMLFGNGKIEHDTYHNQYGHLMAKATWDGFNLKNKNERPFVLTRSGYTGTQKYAAIWTGDNASNWDHLKMSIPMSINLALSGVSFNGPDIGGFALDTTEELFTTWTLAGALFPFLRNHSTYGSKNQEPYAFSKKALSIIRKCICTRAKLLPYIYNQFYLHLRDGHAVMRPLSYEFKGTNYEKVDDQYMIGSSIMVAPFIEQNSSSGKVTLPPGWWFSFQTGKWIKGGKRINVKQTNEMMIFVRDGSILPCSDTYFPQPDFSEISFHVFAKDKMAECEYYEDDCMTRDYQNGKYNLYSIKTFRKGGELNVAVEKKHDGMDKNMEPAFYFYGIAPEGTKEKSVKWPFRSYSTKFSGF